MNAIKNNEDNKKNTISKTYLVLTGSNSAGFLWTHRYWAEGRKYYSKTFASGVFTDPTEYKTKQDFLKAIKSEIRKSNARNRQAKKEKDDFKISIKKEQPL